MSIIAEYSHEVPSLIMSYLDEEPPRYEPIRKIFCSLFQMPENIQFITKLGILDYHLIYQSSLIERVSQANIILIGNFHDSAFDRSANAHIVDSLISNNTALFAESTLCPQDDSEPLQGRVREIVLNNFLLPKSYDTLTVYGWDSIDRIQPILDLEECRMRKVTSTRSKTPAHRGPSLEDIDDEGDDLECEQGVKFEILEHPETIYSTFPERTGAMVESLKQLGQRRAKGRLRGKAFYFAGITHLHCFEELQNSNLSLKSLYRALRTLPAIVICTAQCWNRRQQEKSLYISNMLPFYQSSQLA